MEPIFPQNYESWRKCITKRCNIEFSLPYLTDRVAVFSDTKNDERQKFVALYGESWTKTVFSYFEQALSQIKREMNE